MSDITQVQAVAVLVKGTFAGQAEAAPGERCALSWPLPWGSGAGFSSEGKEQTAGTQRSPALCVCVSSRLHRTMASALSARG